MGDDEVMEVTAQLDLDQVCLSGQRPQTVAVPVTRQQLTPAAICLQSLQTTLGHG